MTFWRLTFIAHQRKADMRFLIVAIANSLMSQCFVRASTCFDLSELASNCRKKTPKKQLPAFDKKLAEKQTALDVMKTALDALAQPDQRAELKRTLEQLTSKKVMAAVQAERSVITAPAAGLFLPPETAPEKLAENDGYGRIVGPTFRAVTTTALVTDADTAVFAAPAGRIDVKLDRTPVGVTARVEGQLKWVGAKGTLEVASGRTPWLLSALR